MPSQPPTPESGHPYATYRQLTDQLETATTTLLAIGGLVDEWRGLELDAVEANRRVQRASIELTALLRIPHEREGAWEAAHVGALETELTAIAAILRGGDAL
jgi:hypothetical protein